MKLAAEMKLWGCIVRCVGTHTRSASAGLSVTCKNLFVTKNHGRWLIGGKLVYPVARPFAEEIMNLPDERKTRRERDSLVVDCQITLVSTRWQRPGVGRVQSYTLLKTFKWPVGMVHSLETK